MSHVLAASNGRELWYLTRSSGIVTLVLLTGTVALGVASTGTFHRERWPRFLTQGLHRNLSLLAIAFLFLHVLTTVVDGYVPIGWANAVIPFTSPYRRLWLGLGTLACDLLLALVLTSIVRRHLRPGLWRGVHLLAYASWPVALLHGVGTGTDATATVLQATTVCCMLLVASAIAWRMAHRFPAGRPVRVTGAALFLFAMLLAGVGLDGGLRVQAARSHLVALAGPGARGGGIGDGAADGDGSPAPMVDPPVTTDTTPVTTPPDDGSGGTPPPAAASVPAQLTDDAALFVDGDEPATSTPPPPPPLSTTTTTPAPPPSPTTTTTTTTTPSTTTTSSTTTTTSPGRCWHCGRGGA